LVKMAMMMTDWQTKAVARWQV